MPIKFVYFVTGTERLVCRNCIHAEHVQTEKDTAVICHNSRAVHTGEKCSGFTPVDGFLISLEKEAKRKKR